MNKKIAAILTPQASAAIAPNKTATIKNAGLVLLNNYIPTLFERLNVITNVQEFADDTARQKAVNYLQFVATGQTETAETWLSLNKALCDIPLAQAVPAGIEITGDDQHLIEGLIDAAISHWPAIGSCSIQCFRGNWLIRDGMLSEFEEHWELMVEKRVYDLLINKAPFSFSIIKYPWMPKPLHVQWPY